MLPESVFQARLCPALADDPEPGSSSAVCRTGVRPFHNERLDDLRRQRLTTHTVLSVSSNLV